METLIKTDQEIITTELANAIASFDIAKINELLSDNGEYCIQDEKDEIVYANKSNFITWLNNLFNDYKSNNKTSSKLNFILDRCSYRRIGNPVIIFEIASSQLK